MEKIIGIITYKKGDKLQILESKLIDSIKSQTDKSWRVVININSYIDTNDLIQLGNIFSKSATQLNIEFIGGNKADQVPIARNELLTYVSFKYPKSAIFMPDDDDVFVDEHALMCMSKAIDKYGLDVPILTSFLGWHNEVKPNPASAKSIESSYRECLGYFNWNAVYSIEFFIKNHLSFPEYLLPPHRSHDTTLDIRAMLAMKGREYIFLSNLIMDYKCPNMDTLSTKTKKPDTPTFDEMEFIYNGLDAKKVGKIVHYDPILDEMIELTLDEYKSLEFNKELEIKGDIVIDFMGQVRTDFEIHKIFNCQGFHYVELGYGPMVRTFRIKRNLCSIDDDFRRLYLKSCPSNSTYLVI